MATTTGGRRGRSASAVLARRVAIGAGVVAVLFFAIEGGEYGIGDLRARRSRRAALELEVQQLQATVDSLQAELDAVEKDPATLERIAREEFGMVKGDRELLYRFAEEEEGDTLR
jgi:cell division protein FtsB